MNTTNQTVTGDYDEQLRLGKQAAARRVLPRGTSAVTGEGSAPRGHNWQFDSESGTIYYNQDHQNSDGTWGMSSVTVPVEVIWSELGRVEAQRDELLAEIKRAYSQLQVTSIRSSDIFSASDILEAAIAKAERSAQ